MKTFTGKTLRWEWREGIVELTLDHAPANELGTAMLVELEKFVSAFGALAPLTSVCIVASARKAVFFCWWGFARTLCDCGSSA